MNYEYIAKLLFPNIKHDISFYEEKYPYRKEKVVTRFAPSPTGFVHIGSLFTSFINRKYASDNNGVCLLRIEDTDQKRLIPGSVTNIINDLRDFDITFDEGMISEEEEKGLYVPYLQSKRLDIYLAYAYFLVKNNLAYPCFCTEEELSNIRSEQMEKKDRIGYYGSYAKCRDLSLEDIKENISKGKKFVIRLKSNGNFNNRIKFKDLVKGEVEFPENDLDIVLIKSDGYPTYHFAHLVDDHLMRVTHVIRGDEWLSSFPIHYQLFQIFNFKLPKYAHISPLMIKDGETTRKISKRRDVFAKVSYYYEEGICYEAVKLYLMTIANTNFEGYISSNPDNGIDSFKFTFKKMSSSGSIFDMDKLLNISKNYISLLSAEDLYDRLLNYVKVFDKDFYSLINKYRDYTINVLNIERGVKKPRKDYSKYSDIRNNIWYMYDELFSYNDIIIKDFYSKDILLSYINNYYDDFDDINLWYDNIKQLCEDFGFAREVKDYKDSPEDYKGHVGDVCELIRVSLTASLNTPDLYQIMKVMGNDRVLKRIEGFCKYMDNSTV